jgi:hypothetical protein
LSQGQSLAHIADQRGLRLDRGSGGTFTVQPNQSQLGLLQPGQGASGRPAAALAQSLPEKAAFARADESGAFVRGNQIFRDKLLGEGGEVPVFLPLGDAPEE